jgi:hypothetical protein
VHITDLKTLITADKTAAHLPLYSSIIKLNHFTQSPLTYVKLERHIALEITNHEEYRWLKMKSAIYTNIGQLKTSLIYIKMNFMYMP